MTLLEFRGGAFILPEASFDASADSSLLVTSPSPLIFFSSATTSFLEPSSLSYIRRRHVCQARMCLFRTLEQNVIQTHSRRRGGWRVGLSAVVMFIPSCLLIQVSSLPSATLLLLRVARVLAVAWLQICVQRRTLADHLFQPFQDVCICSITRRFASVP